MKPLDPRSESAATPKVHPHTFATLDGLRGVAAIAVVLFHYPALVGRQIVPQGYLAVDFFFLLSGFVLTFAYQGRLASGWSLRQFLRVRVARLYPLYCLGLLFGFLVNRLQAIHGTSVGSTSTVLTFLGLGLVFLPYMGGPGTVIFPLNMPSWSVLMELLANVIHAVFYKRPSTMKLLAGIVIGLTGILIAAIRLGNFDFGATNPFAVFALFRVLCSYSLGILLFRFWQKTSVRWKVSPGVISILLVAILAAPIPGRFLVAYEVLASLLLFPMLVFAGASTQPKPRYLRVFLLLGQASYAIYVLQAPLVQLYTRIWANVAHHSAEVYRPWSGLLYACLLVALALFVDYVYDLPARALLKRWLTKGEAKTQRATIATR
ncbi:acyltransferase family protein [Terriglobus sp. RCC_193]|uniref:acyltransferase family protein n=1 Tax=Terriglobus sp. RCC_193 TaxID=3239218 RepID=UPI003523EBAE